MTITILSQDTFTRANNPSSWGTASDGENWSMPFGPSTLSIVSNKGVVSTVTGANLMLLGTSKQTNFDAYVRFSSSNTASTIGLVMRYVDVCDYMRVDITNGLAHFFKESLCTGTFLNPTASPTILAATNYRVHVNVSDNTYSMNVWLDGQSEPAGYQLVVYDATFWNVGGQFGLYTFLATNSDTVSFDSFQITQLAQIGVSVAKSPVTFDEDTWKLSLKADERQRFQTTLLDYPGTARYTTKQQVSVTDPTLGTLFSGVLVDDKLDKTNTYPDSAIEHQIDTVGNEYFADKRTSNRLYNTPTYASKIVADMVSDVLAAEGVIAPLAQQFVSTQTDWASGTLASTTATTNVGDGDLELSGASGVVTQTYNNNATWSTGTLTNTVVNTGGDLSINGVTRNWDDGSVASQTLFGPGGPSQSVVNKQFNLYCNPNSETRSRLDFAGNWQNFTVEVDCYNVGTNKRSITWRTTSWNNNDGSYAYAVEFTQNDIVFKRGSNGGTNNNVTLASFTFSPSLANGTYRLRVVVNGSSMTAYVNGTQYLATTDSTYSATGMLALRNRNIGSTPLTMIYDNFGVMAALSGTWQSTATSINSVPSISSSVITWDQSLSTGGTVLVQTSIDGGSTFQTCSNGGYIPGLTSGSSGTGKTVIVLVTLSNTTTATMPDIKSLTWTVVGGYVASGTWLSSSSLGYDTFTRANQSGFGTAPDGQTWSQVAGTDTLAISSNQGTVTNNGSGPPNRILLGSGTATDCEAFCRITVGDITGDTAGILLRCDATGANHYLARYAPASANTIEIDKRVAGTLSTLASFSAGFTFAAASVMWIRFRIQGTTLSMKAWLDGSQEPASFNSVTDSSLASGQYGLYVNGSPASPSKFDSFRVTTYPYPGLSLTPVGRVGSSVIAWNANFPSSATTLGVDISLDNGLTWTDASQQNGGSIPGLNGQPDPTVDGFATNTSANYTALIGYGGGMATWTWDTASSRVIATNGASAVLLNNAISITNIDLFTDMDYADSGGLVWCYVDPSDYYGLIVADNQASIGTKNLMTLYKVSGAVISTLATGAISFLRGTYHRIRVTNLDGVIIASFDGSQVLTYTDSSPLGAGQAGLYEAGGLTTNYALRTLGPTLDLGTTSGIPTTARFYQLWITPMGDNGSGKTITARCRLATTDSTVTPQVLDLTIGVYPNTIGVGIQIPSADYRQNFLSKMLDDLAKQCNYAWWIDQSKALNFRSRAAIPAPWILQSTTLGIGVDLEMDNNLAVDVANDLYRNRQWLTGVNLTGAFSNTFVGDGQRTSFTLDYPVAPGTTPTITLNTVPQKVQYKGTTGGQYYYAYNDPVIAQDNSLTKLMNTDHLTAAYIGAYIGPVMVENTALQAQLAPNEGGTGIVEAVEDVSKRNMTYAAAVTYGNQLITRYGVAGRTITFATYRNGLQVGQILAVFLPEKGLFDTQMLVISIDITAKTQPNNTIIYQYLVTATELPNPGSWQKLLAANLLLT